MYEVAIEKFSGPYDLLLDLIRSHDLEITEISLAKITEQFLFYVDSLQNKDEHPDELASFLVVAAQLLYMKSKALLPCEPEEDDLDDLKAHLLLYEKFVKAAQMIQSFVASGRRGYPNRKITFLAEIVFSPPDGYTINQIHQSYCQTISRLTPLVTLPQALLERVVSLRERVDQLRSFLCDCKTMNFTQIIMDADAKIDVIVSFLAILELAHQKKISLYQSAHGEDIIIQSI